LPSTLNSRENLRCCTVRDMRVSSRWHPTPTVYKLLLLLLLFLLAIGIGSGQVQLRQGVSVPAGHVARVSLGDVDPAVHAAAGEEVTTRCGWRLPRIEMSPQQASP
jgi:hypothetical protein